MIKFTSQGFLIMVIWVIGVYLVEYVFKTISIPIIMFFGFAWGSFGWIISDYIVEKVDS